MDPWRWINGQSFGDATERGHAGLAGPSVRGTFGWAGSDAGFTFLRGLQGVHALPVP
jgi:hypothetical protein